MTHATATRRFPIGAEPSAEGAHFRVWAPRCCKVEVITEGSVSTSTELQSEEGGYFSGVSAAARAGTLYRFRLDDGQELLPDPGSRFQPQGPHGPSEIIDGRSFAWTDSGWKGAALP